MLVGGASAASDFTNFGVAVPVSDASGASAPWSVGTANPFPTTIHVFGMSGVVTHVTAVVSGLEHQRIDDLNLLLVAPNGQGIQLLSDAGGDLQVGDSDSGFTDYFEDEASTAVPDNGPLLSGQSYKPSNYFGGQGEDALFASTGNTGDVYPAPAPPPGNWAGNSTMAQAFNNSDPNGDWKLFATDDRPGSTGGIDPVGAYVGLEITTGPSLGTAPPANIAPQATFNAARSTSSKSTTVFDASKSLAGGAVATNFNWDVNSDGHQDAECPGSDPILLTKFDSSGSANVTLTVAGGGASSTTKLVTPVSGISPSRRSARTTSGPSSSTATRRQSFICAAHAAVADSADLTAGGGPPAGCNQTVSFDIVEAWGCLTTVDTINQIPSKERSVLGNVVQNYIPGSGARATSASPISGVSTLVNTQQRVIASSTQPVRINGLDFSPSSGASIVLVGPVTAGLLNRDSLPAFIVSSNATISFAGVTLEHGQIRIPLGIADKTKHVHLGDFALTRAPLVGDLPIRGKVGVDLAYKRTQIGASITMPSIFRSSDGDGVTGNATLGLDNTDGLELDNLEIRVPHAAIGGFGVDNLDFKYARKDSTWDASGSVFFPPGASLAARVLIQHGALQRLYVKATPPDPGIQSAPGVFINYLDFTYDGRSGTGFGGGIGVSAGGKVSVPWGDGQCSLVRVDGHFLLTFANPVSYRADGDVFLLCVHLVHGYYEANSNGHFGIGGDADFKIGNDIEFSARLDAALDADANSGHFQIDADLTACVKFWIGSGCVGAEAAVSDVGVGICADLGFTHAGGGVVFPNKVELFADSCDIRGFRPLGRTAQSAAAPGSTGFRFGSGNPSGLVAVSAVGGPPTFTLKGPGGRTIHAGVAQRKKDFVVVPHAGDNTTYVFVRAPEAGAWSVVPDPGVETTSVRVADGTTAPQVSAKIVGRGRSRTLKYKVAAEPGQRVSFELKGKGNAQPIGRARGTRGKLRFKLSAIASGKQQVIAHVTRGGVPREDIVVAGFTAHLVRLPAARRLTVRRSASQAKITWSKVTSAARYLVSFKLSDGNRSNVVTTKRGLLLRGLAPSARGSVRVRALPKYGSAGSARSAGLKSVRPPRIRP